MSVYAHDIIFDKYPMRHWINLLENSMSKYPPTLADNYEIAAYIESIASDYIDEEMMQEYFNGAHAELRLVPIGEISEGNPDGNVRSAKKERAYSKLSIDTMPPLVIEDGIIQDGNHRFRVAKKAGATALWCYVVEEY